MHLTIHTLPIIRNEIRTYKSLIKERDKLTIMKRLLKHLEINF